MKFCLFHIRYWSETGLVAILKVNCHIWRKIVFFHLVPLSVWLWLPALLRTGCYMGVELLHPELLPELGLGSRSGSGSRSGQVLLSAVTAKKTRPSCCTGWHSSGRSQSGFTFTSKRTPPPLNSSSLTLRLSSVLPPLLLLFLRLLFTSSLSLLL